MNKPEIKSYVDLADAIHFIREKYKISQELINKFEDDVKDGIGQNVLVYIEPAQFEENSELCKMIEYFVKEFGIDTKYEWWW